MFPSVFQQTLIEADEQFFSTFPESKQFFVTPSFFYDPSDSSPGYVLAEPAQNEYYNNYPQQQQYQLSQDILSPYFPHSSLPGDSDGAVIVSAQQESVPELPPQRQTQPSALEQQVALPPRFQQTERVSPLRGASWSPSTPASSSRPSIRLSPLPSSKRPIEKKPPLACLFCRGRKIACGPPVPGSTNKTCNQCQRRSLRCEYPSESRRGMRKKKTIDNSGGTDQNDKKAGSPSSSSISNKTNDATTCSLPSIA